MTFVNEIRSVLKENGRAVTLRRSTAAAGANSWTQGAATESFYPGTGRFRRYSPKEIRGAILEGDSTFVVDPSSLSVTPKVGDYIATGNQSAVAGAEWWRVVHIYSPEVGDTAALHRLQCRK